MATNSSSLAVASRAPRHSRDSRRARRAGQVPGVIYGGGQDPVTIAADARELRLTLSGVGAVIDVAVDGGKAEPVVLKDAQRHPVRGEILHVDLLRVDLKQKIHQLVPLELVDMETGVGVKLGGILEQMVREVTVEALPNDIPKTVTISVQELQIGHHLSLAALDLPDGVTLIDDPETVAVNLSAPRLAEEDEEETEELATTGGPAESEDAEDAGDDAK